MCLEAAMKKKNEEKFNGVLDTRPHKKLELYTVDEFGNILDPEGFVVYPDGTRMKVKKKD